MIRVRKRFNLRPDTVHKIDSIAILNNLRSHEVVEILVDMYFDPSLPEIKRIIRSKGWEGKGEDE